MGSGRRFRTGLRTNTKVVANNILSVAYLGEDAEGNLHVGGGDAFGVGGVNENGYAALIKHGIVNDIAAGTRTTPVTDGDKADNAEYKFFAPDPARTIRPPASWPATGAKGWQ